MRVEFSDEGWDDYRTWSDQRRVLERINRLIAEAFRSPGEGAGKPERLRHDLSGYWSRRIDQEHRLVYRVENEKIIIIQCRYHY